MTTADSSTPSPPSMIERQRRIIRDLIRLSAGRAAAELHCEQQYRADLESTQRDLHSGARDIEERFASESRANEATFQKTQGRANSRFEAEMAAAKREYETAKATILEKADVSERQAKASLQEAIWVTETVYEASEGQPKQQFEATRKRLDTQIKELQLAEQRARELVRRYRQRVPSPASVLSARDATTPSSASTPRPGELAPAQAPEPAEESAGITALEKETADCVAVSQRQVQAMWRVHIPRLFQGAVFPLAAILVPGGAGALVWAWRGWKADAVGWAIGGAAAALVIVLGAIALLYVIARRQIVAIWLPLQDAVLRGRAARERCLELATSLRARQEAALRATRDRDMRIAQEKHVHLPDEIRAKRSERTERIEAKYQALLVEITDRRDSTLADSHAQYSQRTTQLAREHQEQSQSVRENEQRRRRDLESRHQAQWTALESAWKQGMERTRREIDEIIGQCDRLFMPWNAPAWNQWKPAAEFAPVIRFGALHVDMRDIPGGIPDDPRLAVPGPPEFDLPAVLEFPSACSLLIETGAEGRPHAIETLQAVMLRLLTSLPPGKVRFTIMDPVLLGQNFAGFMHLADDEEALVGARIWTESRHIEQRLTDLTEHMENVIQKYLRNEFETIEQYNLQAGEIAEPYRFLVIADFPVNFNDSSAKRLASIISSGARCGVYTLLMRDTRQPLPQGLAPEDLRHSAVHLCWESGHFVLKDSDLQPLALALDDPPDAEFLTRILREVGRGARSASRVEVPFDVIVPPESQYWSGDSGSVLRVALGRCGATKLQYLSLGLDTSQHVLIAGKTGSGKSTLLHALITNLALWYSPDEVEFFLIDFKKGVEFKTYATHQIPHVRAVAIESDREFGLSVLHGLDAELKRRGNIFRDLGVQDLAGYRRQRRGGKDGELPAMPRTLLVIDEFQELFVEDDKLSQDAALLLDRLVRQGRAFGMHVVLGSQTLGGAYSLARSTMGQMTVRVALQCGEADSHLILSDDNSAARLLSRPGEAIYNDASGLIEGNSPFQVVWLPESTRERYLGRAAELARQRSHRPLPPPIVFEGSAPADLLRNHLLQELIQRPAWPAPPTAPCAWLGEAIAIKDPTCAVFRRQGGSNLLIVGQRDDAALAMLAASLISLAAQHAPSAARFFILDSTPADDPNAGLLERLASLVPHELRVVKFRDVPAAITELAADVDRRQGGSDADAPATFLLIHGLHRFRMLRRAEDDFGFSAGDADKPPTPDRQFAAVLREGPNAGVHTLAWCDSMSNVSRTLDRQGLREFDYRVLFQMSAADSTNLIDSPLASRLGLRRALLYSEEHGQFEKFRPYSYPSDEWLAEVSRALAARPDADAVPTSK